MKAKPKLLDLCCKAGGASHGYALAGFDVTGIDIEPQPRYPYKFVQADFRTLSLDYLRQFDVLAGSPPCQFASQLTPVARKHLHHNYIPEMREMFLADGKPYIIENVESARRHMVNPVMLCGSMFNLPIFRHRYFENNFGLFFSPASCNHNFVPVLISGTTRRKGYKRVDPPVAERRVAMDIDWMLMRELDEAIPPAYTRWIGQRVLEHLEISAA